MLPNCPVVKIVNFVTHETVHFPSYLWTHISVQEFLPCQVNFKAILA